MMAWARSMSRICNRPFKTADRCHLAAMTVWPALARSGDQAHPLAFLQVASARNKISVIASSILLIIHSSSEVHFPVQLQCDTMVAIRLKMFSV